MTNNSSEVLKQLLLRLNTITETNNLEPQSILIATNAVADLLSQLKAFILEPSFESEAEEIHFFKKIKPQFDGRMIFYLMLLRLDHCLPNNNIEDQRLGCLKELEKIQSFYDQQSSFWLYYRMDHNYLDAHYFLRNAQGNLIIVDEDRVHFDAQTNTLMSDKVARLHAYELFREHIAQTLFHLDQSIHAKTKHRKDLTLTWTFTKVALTELIYALQEHAVFNNTSIDIKKIVDYFSVVFNVKITNIYKTYEDIRLRKKNRTPFLDALRSGLERRIDRDNEYAP